MLAARHLVPVHVGAAGAQLGLEGAVVATHALPVARQRLQIGDLGLCRALAAGQRGDDGAEVGLRG